MLKKILGNKKLVADVILIASVLLLSLSVLLIVTLTREPGASARVMVDGRVVADYPLSVDGEYVLNGGSNILVIEGGAAYMKHADCPDGLCVKQRKKSRSGERIVCLPNRVSIEIIGAGEEIL
jgi:hypothetical protein